MGKNQKSIMVLRIQPKFWWMIFMFMKNNHTKYEQETQRWWLGTSGASGIRRFQNLSKIAQKNAYFGAVWVHAMSMEGPFALEQM